jgi:hypothetical protein
MTVSKGNIIILFWRHDWDDDCATEYEAVPDAGLNAHCDEAACTLKYSTLSHVC